MGKIQCLECGKILESKHRHDFQGCGCPNQTFIDGGKSYMRAGGKDLSKIKVLCDFCGHDHLLEEPKEVPDGGE